MLISAHAFTCQMHLVELVVVLFANSCLLMLIIHMSSEAWLLIAKLATGKLHIVASVLCNIIILSHL